MHELYLTIIHNTTHAWIILYNCCIPLLAYGFSPVPIFYPSVGLRHQNAIWDSLLTTLHPVERTQEGCSGVWFWINVNIRLYLQNLADTCIQSDLERFMHTFITHRRWGLLLRGHLDAQLGGAIIELATFRSQVKLLPLLSFAVSHVTNAL